VDQNNPYQPPAPAVDRAMSPGVSNLVPEVAPCPKCQARSASKVGFTWWGGAIGPRIFSVVKCQSCGTQYKGKTGKKLTLTIIVYQLVAVVVLIVAWALMRS
jgi:hypothetical protein